MFFKIVANFTFLCTLTLILILPFADFLEIEEDDYTRSENNLRKDISLRNEYLDPIRNTNVNINRNIYSNVNEDYSSESDFDNMEKMNHIQKLNDSKLRRSMTIVNYTNTNININKNYVIKNVNQLTLNSYIAVQFRENVIDALGYLLQVVGNIFLTEEQYTSLHLIYTAIREKRVYFFDLLPPFKKFLPEEIPKGKNNEMETVLKIVSKNLPKYLKCTAHFLVREFHYKFINLDNIMSRFKPPKEIFNFYAKIDMNQFQQSTLSKNDILNLQIEPRDENDKITNNLLGPIFVNIINNLYEQNIKLTQDIFVVILVNMPIAPMDPVLEENIFYIFKLGKNNRLPRWDKIDVTIIDKNPYKLIKHIITRLLKVQENDRNVIDALLYILNHIQPPLTTHVNPSYQQMHEIDESDKNSFIILLESIVFPEFNKDTITARNELIKIIQRPKFDIESIFAISNRFIYDNPFDLLLGMLAKLHKILVRKSNNEELVKIIPVIVSSMILKRQMMKFSPTIIGDLYITDLLPSILIEENPVLNNVVAVIQNAVIRDDNLRWQITKVTKNKTSCFFPKQCLVNSLQDVFKKVPQEVKNSIGKIESTITIDTIYSQKEVCLANSDNYINVKYELPYFPEPTTPEETKMRNTLHIFLNTQRFINITKFLDPDNNNYIKPQDLYEFLITILNYENELDSYTVVTINHYLLLLKKYKLVANVILRQKGRTESEMKVDLDGLMKIVIDFDKLSTRDKINYLHILKYIEKNPTIINNSDLDLFKYKTKGKLAKHIFETLIENSEVIPKIKNYMKRLLPFITLIGPGAEEIQVTKIE